MVSPDNVIYSVGGIYYSNIPENVRVVSPKGGGSKSGFNWSNPMSITEFTTDLISGTNTIYWLAAGTYYFTSIVNITRNNIVLYGGFNMTEIDLSQRDYKLNKTNFSGSSTNGILRFTNITSFIADGINFIDGKSTNGAAVYVDNSTINLTNDNIYNNTALTYGGAIYEANNSTITLTNTNIYDNTASSGGGIYIDSTNNLITLNSNIYDNTPDNTSPDIILGGVKTVSLNGSGNGTGLGDGSNNWSNAMSFANFITDIQNGTFTGEYWLASGNYTLTTAIAINRSNVSIYGGFSAEKNKSKRISTNITTFKASTTSNTISAITLTGLANTKLVNNVINNISLTGFNDSSIKIKYVDNTEISNCKIYTNKSSTNGAAISVDSSVITVDSCSVSNNTATANGGGIYSTNSNTYVINSTITNNTAKLGAGLYLDNSTTNVSCVVNCTVIYNYSSDNSTKMGTGIYNIGTSVITNDIIYNNSGNTDFSNYYDLGENYVGRITNSIIGGGLLAGTNIYDDNMTFTETSVNSIVYYWTPDLTANLRKGQYVNTVAYNNIKVPAKDQNGKIRPTTTNTIIGSIEI